MKMSQQIAAMTLEIIVVIGANLTAAAQAPVLACHPLTPFARPPVN